MKITSVTVQGMHNVGKKTYTFKDLNYLRGPNGAGKTTVLQAIQFALFGYIPGQNATNEAVFSHSNGAAMQVKLVLDDDGTRVVIDRVIQRTKKAISSDVSIEPDYYDLDDIVGNVELPVFKFNELLALSPNKLKEWFIGYLPASKESLNWGELLSAEIEDFNGIDKESFIEEMCKAISDMNLFGLAEVKAANQYFKDCVSFYKGKVAASQATIQSLIMYDDVSGEYTEEDINTQIDSINKERDSIHAYNQAVAANNKIREKLSEVGKCVESLDTDAEYLSLLSAQSMLSFGLDDARNNYNSLVSKLRNLESTKSNLQSILSGNGECPYTHSECASIRSKLPEYKSEMQSLVKSIDELTLQIQDASQSISDTEGRLETVNKQLRQIQDKYSCRDILVSQMSDVPAYEPARSEEECEAEIRHLVELLSKIKANARYNQLIDRLTEEKFQNELYLEASKRYVKLSGENGIQTMLMNKPFQEFAVKISSNLRRFFGANVSARFNLVEKANSFSFGLYREDEDTYIPFNLLSSGEKCLYTIAFMIAILNSSDSKLTFVMIDDMLDHLDDDNIDRVFNALKEISDIQFLFAGVKDCNVDDKEAFIQEIDGV